MILLLPLVSITTAAPVADPTRPVAEVLDQWHLAAAKADEAGYFSLMTPEAVFLGTDATERWSREAFRVWAHPFFAKGKAWSFRALKRHVMLSKDQKTAWFDEELETPNMGPARGSGVLVKVGRDWRITHYNLTIPIPNPLMDQVKGLIDQHLKAPKP